MQDYPGETPKYRYTCSEAACKGTAAVCGGGTVSGLSTFEILKLMGCGVSTQTMGAGLGCCVGLFVALFCCYACHANPCCCKQNEPYIQLGNQQVPYQEPPPLPTI